MASGRSVKPWVVCIHIQGRPVCFSRGLRTLVYKGIKDKKTPGEESRMTVAAVLGPERRGR